MDKYEECEPVRSAHIEIPTWLFNEMIEVCAWYENLFQLYRSGTYDQHPDKGSMNYLYRRTRGVKRIARELLERSCVKNRVINLEILRNGTWTYHSRCSRELLPQGQVKKKAPALSQIIMQLFRENFLWNQVEEKGLPGDMSRPVLNSHNYDCKTFVVFGESYVSQKHLERFGHGSREILKETRGDQLRLVMWDRSWKIQPEK